MLERFYLIGLLKGTANPSQNGSESNGYEAVSHILQISSLGTSPPDGLVSYSECSIRASYSSVTQSAWAAEYTDCISAAG